MMFWSLVAALVAGVAALVIAPAWRRPRTSAEGTEHDQLRRFAELDTDVATGEVAQDQAPLLRAELERAVLDAVPTQETHQHLGNRWLLAAIVVAALLAAIPLYEKLGMPRLAELGLDVPGRDTAQTQQTIDELLERVRERTRNVPDDREAWTMLARSTLALGDYDEALAAAERAHALDPDDVAGKLLLVDALAMQADGRLGDRANALLDAVLAQNPEHPTALVLTGIAAQQRGDDATARDHWQRALALLPSDAPFRAELVEMLARVGADPDRAETTTQEQAGNAAPAASEVAIEASVRLAPELADAAADEATLFVIARAVDGPPAPLAVARHRVADLPLTVRLDDSMAMIPGATLAAAGPVYVVARVSQSGNALPEAGDLQGHSAAFDPRRQTVVEIVIDTVRK
ncbi:MAG: c-type cytochrome biogenesis protein CcmI [Gammaproteobacteria bacterium]